MWFERTDDANELWVGVADLFAVATDDEHIEEAIDKDHWDVDVFGFFERVKLHERVLETFAKCRPGFISDFHAFDKWCGFVDECAAGLHGVGVFFQFVKE